MKIFILLANILLINYSAWAQCQLRAWPIIEPLTNELHFVDHQTNSAKILIYSTNGVSAYQLECYLNAYDYDGPEFNYSGAFECRLTSCCESDAYSTLLADCKEPTRDWQSYGRFLAEDLTNASVNAVNATVVRQFQLRGMRIALTIKNVVMGLANDNPPWGVSRVKHLDLVLVVLRDPTAISDIPGGVGTTLETRK